MREILFRGKRKECGEWVEGDVFHTYSKRVFIVNMSPNNAIEVDPKTVCQYTGLTDNNGKKIFEGDIVAFTDTYSTDNGYAEEDCIGNVVWDENEVCFYVTERLSAESWEVLQECYVIGNIFDNPESLNT